jgi:small subunit ribosomal protein S17
MSEELTNPQQTVSQTLIAQVIGSGMEKTAVVLLERQVKHKRYGKYIKRHTKLYVHDEENQCKAGDTIMISQCRPVSKLKTWQLVKILETTV